MSKLKLLVVDDEPGIRFGIKRTLMNYSVSFPFMDEDFTFDVLEAETGEKAIEIIESEGVDIMLLDNKLPGMDGIEVLNYINKKEYDISVTMITSYASLDLAVKATNYGAYNFIPKPFTPQEIKTSLENVTKNLFLKRMTQKMRQEDKQVKFQFLSVLSHELKSPINAIEGYLKIIQEKQVGEQVDDYMLMINRSIERIKGMRTLILDLLDLTKMESNSKQRRLVNVDLNEIAKRVIDTVEPLAIQKNVKIYFEGEENSFINADSNEIEIIFNNLISNAVKYNRDGGKVYIHIASIKGFYQITVEDTGIGISKDDQALLFQDFVRIRNEKTKDTTGSGLGLSIAKKMVELYKGTIELESTPDVGSKFIVKLPISLI